MQIAWNLQLLVATLATVALVLVPQPAQCQNQSAKQWWDPMVNPMCPQLPECGRGRSLAGARDGGQCCPSCAAYKGECSSICVRQNFASSSCWASCGDAGCKRGRCGEPVDGGAQCCSANLVKGCTDARSIYLNSDCCPVCWTNATAPPPMSPPQCRFNATRGVGQPMCDSLGNCKLAAVGDRRDDSQVDFSVINLVCTQAEFAPLMVLGRLDDSFNVFAMGMDGGGDGGNISGNRNITGGGSNGSGSGGGGSGGSSGGPGFDLAALTLQRARIQNFIRNLTMMPAAAQRVASLTCRQPMVCITAVLDQMVPILNQIVKPLIDYITQAISTRSLPSVTPDSDRIMKNLTTRLQRMTTEAAKCMALVQSQSPCVLKAQSINFDELVRSSRCNMSSPSDFQALQRLAAKVAEDVANNQAPGLGTLATVSNCSDVRSPCVADFINNLIDRTASGCLDANLLRAARERMRRLLLDCTGGSQNLTSADIANALVNCQLTAADITQIASAAPSRLQAVLQDRTNVDLGGATQSLGALVQSRVTSSCPEVKSSIDRALAQFTDIARLSASDVKQMVNVIKPDQIGRVSPNQWLQLGPQDLADISAKLKTDPNRDSKCAEIVRLCNQSLLANLTACIDKIPPEKLRSLFSSGPELQQAAQSFNVRTMAPKDIARSKSVLRDMLSSVTVTADNCLTYMNSLFSFPKERIDQSVCLNDTCFKEMVAVIPDHANTVHCRSLRPRPSLSSMVSLGPQVMAQLTPSEVTSALSGTSDSSSFVSLVSSFAETGSSSGSSGGSSSGSSSGSADYAERLDKMKRKTVLGAVMQKFQENFLTASSLPSFDASSVDSALLCQMNSQQLKLLPCSQMPMVAFKAAAFVGSVNRGAGRAVIDCMSQMYANFGNISATALSQISSFALFINETELDNLPAEVLTTYCQRMQSVSMSEKTVKLPVAQQRKINEKCVSRVDMSSVGGSNVTDAGAIAVWNSTIVKAMMVCALTTPQIGKLDQDAAEYLVSVLPTCGYNDTFLKAVCSRLFKIYNDSATSGNYSLTTIGMCSVYLGTRDIANTSKVNRDDVRANAGAVSAAFRQNTDACFTRSSNGLQSDCSNSYDTDASGAYTAILNVLSRGSPVAPAVTSRRKRSTTTALTCSDIQNLASGVAQLTAEQISGMTLSEFQSCFSTFGLTNANWGSSQCTQLKAKTEASYNTTNLWTSTVMLTVGCLTQCWSSNEIANIPYSDVAHISDIGKYCKLMSGSAKVAIVSNYINRTKSNNSATMTRTELSSLGYLACGAITSYVENFNATNVLNSLTELGTSGPCDASVMQSYVNRLKATSLGSTVSTWQSSYFTSLANLISGLSSTDFPTLTAGQIGYIDASVISGMTVSKFSEFTTSQLSTFSAAQRSAVSTSQLAALTTSQRSALGYSTATSAADHPLTSALIVLGCLAASIAGRLF